MDEEEGRASGVRGLFGSSPAAGEQIFMGIDLQVQGLPGQQGQAPVLEAGQVRLMGGSMI